jgi:hypothetical protein
MERVAGVLQVRRSKDTNEIVIHHPGLKPGPDGAAEIVLSPRYARHLANLLLVQAAAAEEDASRRAPGGSAI